MILALLAFLSLSWDASPDPGVTYYRVAFQMYYRFDVACPTPESPEAMCATYTPGAWTETTVLDSSCGSRCVAPTIDLPMPGSGEVLWFQLVAGRDSGCEGDTAFPPL